MNLIIDTRAEAAVVYYAAESHLNRLGSAAVTDEEQERVGQLSVFMDPLSGTDYAFSDDPRIEIAVTTGQLALLSDALVEYQRKDSGAFQSIRLKVGTMLALS